MAELGRPSKLAPEIQEKIVQALVLGNHRQDAAEFAGIHSATLRRWLLRGLEEEDGPYAEFRQAVLEAEARAKITAMGCITKAVRNGDWKAAAWYLQKKYPHQFSEHSQLFLISKVFEQIETAAEAGGTPIPQSVWETAWAALAQEFSRQVPTIPGVPTRLEPGGTDDLFEAVDVSEEERRVLLKVVRATKRGRPEQALPLRPGNRSPDSS